MICCSICNSLPSSFSQLVPHAHNSCEEIVKFKSKCLQCFFFCCCYLFPGVCIGSSSQHIVTFDGLNFKLTGNCSYTLFQDLHHDVEVLLHEGPCKATPRMNCMDSIEVKHRGVAVQLFSDMAVSKHHKFNCALSASAVDFRLWGQICSLDPVSACF